MSSELNRRQFCGLAAAGILAASPRNVKSDSQKSALTGVDDHGRPFAVIRTAEYYGDALMRLPFPRGWQIQMCKMRGHDALPLTDEQIRKALRDTIGTDRIAALAQGKQSVVITFDDCARPTPSARVVPFVLEELHAAGVADDRIFFHAAFGSHAAMSQQEMTIKLGAGVVAKYPTWNHDCFNGVQSVGTTSKGMEVKLSKRFLDAEFKICISGVKPHAMAGYGGGAKSITPGVASIDTIGHIHNILDNEYPSAVGFVTNVIRQQMEEAARLARLDMSVNIVMNGEREVAGVFAGDVVDAHRSAVRMAHPNYETEIPKNMDVVITNTYPQSVEAGKEMKYFNMSLRPGGTAVLIQDTPAGQRKIHYIGWKQDSERAGLKKNGNSGLPAAQAGQMIIFCRWPSKWDQLPYSDKVYFASSWDEVLTQLGKRHGEGTKVALYPCAALQHEPIELRI